MYIDLRIDLAQIVFVLLGGNETMKKNYCKTGRSCRVTFELPTEVAAKTVALCGEFNNWDPTKHPLIRRKDGHFSITISLQSGKSYRFRYLLDGNKWENDWDADQYLPNDSGTEDSVVIV
jgi:1,4-alpha-glucan branching enzyme